MDQQKRFYVALSLYVALALLVWMMIDNIPIHIPVPTGYDHRQPVFGDVVLTLRQLTWLVLGMFALRTVLHWNAERIRAQREKEQVSS